MDKEYRSIQMMTISLIDYIPKGQMDRISAQRITNFQLYI
jgi:hypothetical protein